MRLFHLFVLGFVALGLIACGAQPKPANHEPARERAKDALDDVEDPK